MANIATRIILGFLAVDECFLGPEGSTRKGGREVKFPPLAMLCAHELSKPAGFIVSGGSAIGGAYHKPQVHSAPLL